MTGKLTIETISIWCPKCNEFVPDECGSNVLYEYDYDRLPNVISCLSCGAEFGKPKSAFRRASKKED